MNDRIVRIVKKNRIIYQCARSVKRFYDEIKLYITTNKILKRADITKRVIFYLGIPAHNNLGDLAQGMCIRRWIKRNYPECVVVEVETNALVNTRFSLLRKLAGMYKEHDLIIFQSGYTTTDLGGYADIMHKAVIRSLPDAQYIMMPQTIYFKDINRKRQTSQIYSLASKMLFLARDTVSYEMACEMFKNIKIKLYPDIVTTLIGKYSFDYKREGIMLCARNDGEKYYSEEQLSQLVDKCKKICKIARSDTTKKNNNIIKNAEMYINNEIDTFAHYRLTITDRYHGTILSLAAGTPVIIIKTTDHKVITGADWFKGVYDDYVYVAKDLNDAYSIAQRLLTENLSHKLEPYFEKAYYEKLKDYYEGLENDNM